MTTTSMSVEIINCNLCGGGHHSFECQSGNPFSSLDQQVNCVENYKKLYNNFYSNTYNPKWKQHPNLSWSNQGARPPQVPTVHRQAL